MRLLLLLISLLMFPVAAWAEKVALVIGNSDYEFVGRLPNPQNDADDVAEVLEEIGFDVTVGINLDYRGMRFAIRNFAQKARGADVVFVYYAGHGVEMDNTNFLIPVNAELRNDIDVQLEAIRLDVLIDTVSSSSSGLKVVLVDACRTNPFLSDMTVTSGTRSIGRGLGRVDPTGVLVGYSARGGTLALDGDGRNSPYAKALVNRIPEPGLELGKMFRKIRDDVYRSTDGYQEPFVYGSLPGQDIYLVPAALPQPQEQTADNGVAINTAPQDDAATAGRLLREAMTLTDDTARQGVLNMLARLYPDTDAGKTARYLADTPDLSATTTEPENAEADTTAPAADAPAPDAAGIVAIDPPAAADPVVNSAKATETALKLSRTDYVRMQRALNTLGFSVGTEDGIFGPRSRAGLTRYQSQNGQESSGYLTASAVSGLRAVQLPRKAEPVPEATSNTSASQTEKAKASAPASVSAVTPQQFVGTYYCQSDIRGIWDGQSAGRKRLNCLRLKSVVGADIEYDSYVIGAGAELRTTNRAHTEPLSRFSFPSNTSAQFQFGGKTFVRAPQARIR